MPSPVYVNPHRQAAGTVPSAGAGTAAEAAAFHRTLEGYAPTPLINVEGAAPAAIERLLVKAELERFGLPSFKFLGASWATWQACLDWLDLPAAPTPATLTELRAALAAERPVRLVTATDGNHGRAVARMASLLGLACLVFVPEGTAPARIEAIRREQADVEVVRGTYDDAVRAAAQLGSSTSDQDHVVVSDTSWPGYEVTPRWVIDGYTTLLAELDDQLASRGGWAAVDLMVVPLGVGALGAAVAGHIGALGAQRPMLVGVEPERSACVQVAVASGAPQAVPGPHASIMAGLNCGTASAVALPAIRAAFDCFVTVSDDKCRAAVRALAAAGLDVGECSAAGVAALEVLARHDLVRAPGRALVLATEGVTDPDGFAGIVGRAPTSRQVTASS